MTFERVVVIAPTHPSLPGHFPGNPVVPGVVLLNEIMDSLGRMVEQPVHVTELPSVKFLSPLRPGEALTICLVQEESGQALFRCLAGVKLVAQGTVKFTLSPRTERASS
jgi:3-hydroxyacyl-[acyl-carrier-protein] dehydratase